MCGLAPKALLSTYHGFLQRQGSIKLMCRLGLQLVHLCEAYNFLSFERTEAIARTDRPYRRSADRIGNELQQKSFLDQGHRPAPAGARDLDLDRRASGHKVRVARDLSRGFNE